MLANHALLHQLKGHPKRALLIALPSLFLLSDCTTNDLGESRGLSKTQTGAIMGTVSRNVNPLRLEAYGRGESEPRADNSTEAGRALNRRVELWILPVLAN